MLNARKGFLFLWMMLSVSVVVSQQLSMDSCLNLALRNHVTVKNAVLDVEMAKEVKRQLFTKYFPNVSAMAGGYHAINPLIEYGIDDVDNAAVRQWLHNLYFEQGAAMGLPNAISLCENGLTVGATAVQPVFMGGQIVNGNRLAEVGVKASELQCQLTKDQLSLQVEESYWLVVSLLEKKRTLMQALTFLDTLHRDVTAAKEAGLVTQNEQLKVSLKQNEMRSNMLKINNGITLATMALCQLVGVDYAESIVLSDTIPTIMENYALTDLPSAVAARKESQLLTLNVEAEQLRKKITIGETLPHLTVGAGTSYGNLVFDKFGANGLAFALLQVPITSWWETSHKIKQQNYMIQKAENQRVDLCQKMQLETQQAYNNLQEAADQVVLMKSTVEDADANLQSVKVNYEAGMVAVSELLEAQTLHRQAQDQLVEARIDYQLKLAKWRTLTR